MPYFWLLAEIEFQQLFGARNVTIDFNYDVVIMLVFAWVSRLITAK